MLYIVDYKLRDNTKMQAVLEAESKDGAKNKSLKVFNIVRSNGIAIENKFNIDSKCCLTVERWDVEHKVYSNGMRTFSVIISDSYGSCNSTEIRADGHKTAYNNAISNLPKDKRNYIIYLYDKSQKGKYKSGKEEAEKVLADETKTKELLVESNKKAQEVDNKTNFDIFEDVKLLCNVVYDYVKGYYTAIPYKTIIAIVVALLYFVSPIDIIPDVLITFYGLGLVDDVAVVMFIMKAVHSDLMDYNNFKSTPEYVKQRKERDKVIAQKKKEGC